MNFTADGKHSFPARELKVQVNICIRGFSYKQSGFRIAKLRNPCSGGLLDDGRNVIFARARAAIEIQSWLFARKPKHRLEISSMARHHYPPITPIIV